MIPIMTYQLTTSAPGGLVVTLLVELGVSSPKGRDWSCFKNTVIITVLSGVGAALSAGAAFVNCAGPRHM